MKKFAVIVGGGHGSRLGSEIPKQFLPLLGQPIIFHTIEKFSGIVDQVILVLPESHFEYWNLLCETFIPATAVKLVVGGKTRAQSVRNGLMSLSGQGIVAVHDAVRPLVSKNLINSLFHKASETGNAVPSIPLRESIRKKDGAGSKAVNRDEFMVVQTPQCFDLEQLLFAYENAGDLEFSDDAGMIEHFGTKINHVQGENFNIKITFKEDLVIAEALMNAMKL